MFSNGDNNQPVVCWLTFLFNPGVVMGVAKAYVIISIFRVNNLVSTKCMAANSRVVWYQITGLAACAVNSRYVITAPMSCCMLCVQDKRPRLYSRFMSNISNPASAEI